MLYNHLDGWWLCKPFNDEACCPVEIILKEPFFIRN